MFNVSIQVACVSIHKYKNQSLVHVLSTPIDTSLEDIDTLMYPTGVSIHDAYVSIHDAYVSIQCVLKSQF